MNSYLVVFDDVMAIYSVICVTAGVILGIPLAAPGTAHACYAPEEQPIREEPEMGGANQRRSGRTWKQLICKPVVWDNV